MCAEIDSFWNTLGYFSDLFRWPKVKTRINIFKSYIVPDKKEYRISPDIRQSFLLPKQSQRSRSVLLDGSRSFGLFRKDKIGIIAKFHRTDLVI